MLSEEDFLKMEFPQSVNLVMFYDTRQNELVKFASGLAAAVPTAILAFRGTSGTSAKTTLGFTAVVAMVGVISLVSIFAALVQNRVYFVFSAREANALRARMIEALTGLDKTEKNLMYQRHDFPMFVPLSSHTLQLAFVALQAGSLVGIVAFALGCPIGGASVTAIVFSAVAVLVAARYLSAKGQQTADNAVHPI